MTTGITYLHSHSALERELRFPKHIVLVDAKYKSLFADCIEGDITPFSYYNVDYYKVPILAFVRKGGIFKNFMR